MLPEYIIEKKLSIVSYIYQKIKKKKYIKKGILLKEDENTYYVIEEMDEIDENNPIIVYIDDGVKKNIISTNFFTVSLDKNYRECYVLCKLSNKLKYYCDTTSFIEFFLNL